MLLACIGAGRQHTSISKLEKYVPPRIFKYNNKSLAKSAIGTKVKDEFKCTMKLAWARLGCPHGKAMNRLGYSMPSSWFQPADMAKMRKKNISKMERIPAEYPGERVAMDICGPFPVAALSSNARYIIGFKDAYSNRNFVYPVVYPKEKYWAAIVHF